jgi:uncharacterized membrane protein
MSTEIGRVLALFSALDLLGVAALLLAWGLTGWLAEHPPAGRPSMQQVMIRYRERWMAEMLRRDNRIFDTTTLASLRSGVTFFISACMIGIGGGVAMVGQAERLAVLAADLGSGSPRVVWEAKLLLVVLILAAALLRFVWSHRVFGYCAVVMAAVPGPNDPEAAPMARKAALMNVAAARNFNTGLRGLYFALAALAWLLGPVPFLLATLLTTFTLMRREFYSASRQALLE